MLEIRDLAKSFGGVKATDNVSLDFADGSLTAVIGPNGAGKSTFFNLITGHLKPDRGSVSFEGRDLIGLPPQKIVRLGIARSFQRINIYPRLTVFENIQVALIAHGHQQWNLLRPGRSLHREARSINAVESGPPETARISPRRPANRAKTVAGSSAAL